MNTFQSNTAFCKCDSESGQNPLGINEALTLSALTCHDSFTPLMSLTRCRPVLSGTEFQRWLDTRGRKCRCCPRLPSHQTWLFFPGTIAPSSPLPTSPHRSAFTWLTLFCGRALLYIHTVHCSRWQYALLFASNGQKEQMTCTIKCFKFICWL